EFPVSRLLIGLWLVGVGVSIGIQAMALAQLHRVTAGATREESGLLAEAAHRAGLGRVPELWVARSPVEPLTVGLLRPRILIGSDDQARLSSAEMLAILTHECTHIKRNDLFLSLVPWLAQTLFWFLPPIYLALREFELAREAACDRQTIAALSLAPRTYGELLVKLSSSSSPVPVPSSAMALSAGFTDLKRRIEMLPIQPCRRRLIVLASLLVAGLLVPWRLTSAAPALQRGTLPNLDFAQGLTGWYKTAMGSDSVAHPYYEVGVEQSTAGGGERSGFVKARASADFARQAAGDGGVLRYDVDDVSRYAGKRLRWRGFVRGKDLSKHAFLFAGTFGGETDGGFSFTTSPKVLPDAAGWQERECVFDVAKDATGLFLGLRLEGKGDAFANRFSLTVVDGSVPLSSTRIVPGSETIEPIRNLRFADGLTGWWNDNPTHKADTDYAMTLAKGGGRNGNDAACLKSQVPTPRSYGTIAQNAAPGAFRGKRIRLSAYLKSENAKAGDLWIVVADKDPNKGGGANGEASGKMIRGTQGWTRFEHVVDVPESTRMLSFGISSEGPGTVWVDGFTIEIIGPAQARPDR
ncbi:MAG: M56 family metallopeptidase, partial [Fibrella sp.]|nr:M56 family metallopeptidase [Armatimonadota bacterium]